MKMILRWTNTKGPPSSSSSRHHHPHHPHYSHLPHHPHHHHYHRHHHPHHPLVIWSTSDQGDGASTVRLLRPSSKADWSLQDEWSLLQVTIIINIIITILTTCHICHHLQPTQHWQSSHPAKKPLQVGTLAAHTKGIPLQYCSLPAMGFLPLGFPSSGVPSNGNFNGILMGFPSYHR